jgi:hypothetical protein
MSKNYFSIFLFLLFIISFNAVAQEVKSQDPTVIEGLSFYPNPVSNGKVYITSKLGLEKEIVIFDVLGKKVFQGTLNSKELNISAIAPGIYIIKIKENEATATRKLIVK